eukprot:26193-Pelagococcus_subviridis.AAC.5
MFSPDGSELSLFTTPRWGGSSRRHLPTAVDKTRIASQLVSTSSSSSRRSRALLLLLLLRRRGSLRGFRASLALQLPRVCANHRLARARPAPRIAAVLAHLIKHVTQRRRRLRVVVRDASAVLAAHAKQPRLVFSPRREQHHGRSRDVRAVRVRDFVSLRVDSRDRDGRVRVVT